MPTGVQAAHVAMLLHSEDCDYYIVCADNSCLNHYFGPLELVNYEATTCNGLMAGRIWRRKIIKNEDTCGAPLSWFKTVKNSIFCL